MKTDAEITDDAEPEVLFKSTCCFSSSRVDDESWFKFDYCSPMGLMRPIQWGLTGSWAIEVEAGAGGTMAAGIMDA